MLRAREVAPLFAMTHALSAQVAFAAREYPVAVEYARRATVVEPRFWIGYLQLGQALEQAGEPAEALEALERASRLTGNSKMLSVRGFILARLGRHAEARAILDTMKVISSERYFPPYAIALVHAGLGERDAAFEWLDRAYEAGDVHLIFLPIDAKWDTFRSDSRFGALVKRCGFTVN
jgi:tetratricopeptide (TPR) repeat protein